MAPSRCRARRGICRRDTAAVPVEQVHRDGCSALAAIPSSVCRCRSAWNVSTATGTGRRWPPNGPDSYMPGPPSNDNEQADSSSCLPSAAYAVGNHVPLFIFASANKRYI